MHTKRTKKFTEEELQMMNEMDALMEEVKKHPNIANAKVPENLWRELKRDIAEYNAEQKLEEEKKHQEELIRLGLVYQRKRKFRKYYALAAAAIMALAFGITSFGGPERIFYNIRTIIAGREQEIIGSEGTVPINFVNEDEALEQIEKELGIYPVKLNYLPNNVAFFEMSAYDEIQGICMYYGNEDRVKIIYTIKPNYREGAWALDIEDEFVEEFEMEISNTIVRVKEYKIDDGTSRWIVLYSYNDVGYSLTILDIKKEEVEKIISNLHFAP